MQYNPVARFNFSHTGPGFSYHTGAFMTKQMGQIRVLAAASVNLFQLFAADSTVVDFDQDMADVERWNLDFRYFQRRFLLR